MTQSQNRQTSFSRLATGQSSTRRTDILLAATDAFCAAERPEKTQSEQFRELFYSLISQTDEISKRLISMALARHEHTPRQVLLYLSLESAAIAAPVLAYSSCLSQFDLLQIINKTSDLHHRVIANRRDLGQTVINKLIELDDKLVMRKLRQNPTIDIADSVEPIASANGIVDQWNIKITPPPQLEQNSGQPASPEAIPSATQEPKVSQVHDETQLHTNRLPAPAAVSSPVNPMARSKAKNAMDELVDLANRGKKLGSLEDLLEDLPSPKKVDFAATLLDATVRRSRQDQVIAIEQEFVISNSTAAAIFDDQSGDTLAVTLKAVDLDPQNALQIIALSISNVGLSQTNTQRTAKIYQALNQQVCLQTVHSWRQLNKSQNTKYQPVTQDTGDVAETKQVAPKQQPMWQREEVKSFGN